MTHPYTPAKLTLEDVEFINRALSPDFFDDLCIEVYPTVRWVNFAPGGPGGCARRSRSHMWLSYSYIERRDLFGLRHVYVHELAHTLCGGSHSLPWFCVFLTLLFRVCSTDMALSLVTDYDLQDINSDWQRGTALHFAHAFKHRVVLDREWQDLAHSALNLLIRHMQKALRQMDREAENQTRRLAA